jgi:transposase
VPLWGVVTWFLYAARRVNCPEHGVVVEHVPWSEGKRPVTMAMMCFLSRWARRLSWRETARAFGTSWECVYRSVEWFVQWGLAHRKLEGIKAIGVDEIHWGKSKRAEAFLTVIYQIDGHCRRLLWVGRKTDPSHLAPGLGGFGGEGGRRIALCVQRHVAALLDGDRPRPARRCMCWTGSISPAFEPGGGSSAPGGERAAAGPSGGRERLKKMRWKLLRKGSRVRGRAKRKLCGLASKLATGRAWMLKETFQISGATALTFGPSFSWMYWTERALRSRWSR